MNGALWFHNLLAFYLQVAGIAIAGVLLPRVLRLRAPRVLYVYWQALLAACLLLPLLQPWQRTVSVPSGTSASRIVWDLAPASSASTAFPFASAILVCVASGICLRLAWLALGLAKLRRLRKTALPVDLLSAEIGVVAARLGVTASLSLSDEIAGPVTFGLRRPAILLPAWFNSLEPAHQQAIAAHELLHLARRDWAFHLVEEIVVSVFWFHPAVWWLVGRIRLSREQVVDRQVVELTGARKPYLHALLDIAVGTNRRRDLLAPAFLRESQLAERIRTLVKEASMSKRRVVMSIGAVIGLTLVTGLLIVQLFPLKAGAASLRIPANNKNQDTTKVETVGKDVSAPEPTFKPDPPYTKEARAAKLKGDVALSVVVQPDGSVSEVQPKHEAYTGPKGESEPDKGLTANAVNTIKTWKFNPALKQRKPVACRILVEVSFRLY